MPGSCEGAEDPGLLPSESGDYKGLPSLSIFSSKSQNCSSESHRHQEVEDLFDLPIKLPACHGYCGKRKESLQLLKSTILAPKQAPREKQGAGMGVQGLGGAGTGAAGMEVQGWGGGMGVQGRRVKKTQLSDSWGGRWTGPS